MDIGKIREAIPVTKNMIYMNTGWSGPSPERVTSRIKELLTIEMEQGPATLDASSRNREIHAELTQNVARLLNAPEGAILPTQCTTHGLVIVVNGMDWKPGDEIVTCSLEHPSVMLPSLMLQETHGVKVRIADIDPKDDKETILAKIADCITPNTRLAFFSHVQFSCGLKLPAKEVAQLVHEKGAYLLLDGAQGAGHLALDMVDMDCDFYAIPGQKWLLGPDGTGALYIREQLIPEISPRYPTHGAVESWDMSDLSVVFNTDSSRKYRISTTITALEAGMAEAIAFNLEIGPMEVETRSRELAAILEDTLREIPGLSVTSPDDAELASALVTVAATTKEPREIVETLWDRGIAARQVPTPQAIRLCTAVFNTEDEIRQVGAVLGEIVGG